MATVNEYQQLAQECVRWASRAKTEGERMAFLEMAHVWTLAAVRQKEKPRRYARGFRTKGVGGEGLGAAFRSLW